MKNSPGTATREVASLARITVPDYSRQEAEEILKRAMAREHEDGVSHDDLLAAAEEVGIDPKAVEAAAGDLERERELGIDKAVLVKEHRRGFGRQVANLLFLNGIVLSVDVMTGPGAFYHWVALGSAVILGSRAIRTYFPSEGDLVRAEKRLLKRRYKRERERRKHRRRQPKRGRDRPRPEDQFERVVEEGVEALLHAAADRIEAYNRQRRSGGPRVRVDVHSGGHEHEDDRDRHESDRPRRSRSDH